MDSKTLINLLNFSKTLIQNGEIKFLFYRQNFMPPEEVGVAHSEVLEDLERQLRENPPKDDDPEALRKEILKQIELEKKYGALEDSNEWFQFIECNLAFHMDYTYRLEIISRFENFPSLGSLRFYGGDGQFCRYSNSSKRLERVFPGHLDNDVTVGSFAEYELDDPMKAYMYEVFLAAHLPPPVVSIDETNSKVHLTKNSAGMPLYIITQFYKGKISYKFYVRINNGLPEVYKEEYYVIDDPSHPEGKQNYLSYVRLYRNFERVEKLNITIPKVVEVKLLALDEVSIEQHTIVEIKERSLNLEFPTNFFDWDKSDLTGNNDRNNKIHGDVEKEEPQETQK